MDILHDILSFVLEQVRNNPERLLFAAAGAVSISCVFFMAVYLDLRSRGQKYRLIKRVSSKIADEGLLSGHISEACGNDELGTSLKELEASICEIQEVKYTDIRVGEWFQYQRIYGADFFNTRAPEVLTGLGIAGTFAGLIFGLLGVDIEDTESLKQLVNFVAFAFTTSLVGLLEGILFQFLFSLHSQKLEKVLREFVEVVHNHVTFGATPHTLKSINWEIKTLNSSMMGKDGLKVAIEKMTKELVKAIGDTNLKNVTDNLQTAMTDLVTQTKTLSGLFTTSITDYKDLHAAIKGATEALAPAAKKLESASSGLVSAVKDATGVIGQILADVGGLVSALNHAAEESASASHNLSQHVDEFTTATHTFAAASNQAGKAIEAAASQTSTQLGKVGDQISNSATALAEQTNAFIDAIGQFNQQQQDTTALWNTTVDQVTDRIGTLSNGLSQVNGTAESILTGITNLVQSSEGMSEHLPALTENLAEASVAIAGTKESLAQLAQVGPQLESLTTEWTNASSSLKETAEAYKGFSTDANKLLAADWKQVKNDVSGLIQAYDTASKGTKTEIAALNTTLADLQKKMTGLATAIANVQGSISGFETAVDKAGDNLGNNSKKAISGFNEGLTKLVKDLEQDFSGQLKKPAEDIGKIIDYIATGKKQ